MILTWLIQNIASWDSEVNRKASIQHYATMLQLSSFATVHVWSLSRPSELLQLHAQTLTHDTFPFLSVVTKNEDQYHACYAPKNRCRDHCTLDPEPIKHHTTPHNYAKFESKSVLGCKLMIKMTCIEMHGFCRFDSSVLHWKSAHPKRSKQHLPLWPGVTWCEVGSRRLWTKRNKSVQSSLPAWQNSVRSAQVQWWYCGNTVETTVDPFLIKTYCNSTWNRSKISLPSMGRRSAQKLLSCGHKLC